MIGMCASCNASKHLLHTTFKCWSDVRRARKPTIHSTCQACKPAIWASTASTETRLHARSCCMVDRQRVMLLQGSKHAREHTHEVFLMQRMHILASAERQKCAKHAGRHAMHQHAGAEVVPSSPHACTGICACVHAPGVHTCVVPKGHRLLADVEPPKVGYASGETARDHPVAVV
eukprot:204504-Chlamydomonas_euryale.AAC.2